MGKKRVGRFPEAFRRYTDLVHLSLAYARFVIFASGSALLARSLGTKRSLAASAGS